MLRPSRRHVHERISQTEDAHDAHNNNSGVGDNNHTVAGNDVQQTGPTIIVLEGGEQHQQQLTEEQAGPGSSDGNSDGEMLQPSGDDTTINGPSDHANNAASNNSSEGAIWSTSFKQGRKLPVMLCQQHPGRVFFCRKNTACDKPAGHKRCRFCICSFVKEYLVFRSGGARGSFSKLAEIIPLSSKYIEHYIIHVLRISTNLAFQRTTI